MALAGIWHHARLLMAEGVDRETLSKALPRLRGWGDEGLRGSRLRGDRRRC